MKISKKTIDDVVVLSLSGKIMGGPDYDLFRDEIKSNIEAGGLKILLDFEKVRFINSMGLGLLISGYTSLTNAGGTLKGCSVGDRVKSLFYVTDMIDILDIAEDIDEGIAAFS